MANLTAAKVNRVTYVEVKGGALIPGFGRVEPQLAVPCAPFRVRGVRSIAIVGNGPLGNEQHDEIRGADLVVRFNSLNNRLPGEPMHVWFLRHRSPGPLHYGALDDVNAVSNVTMIFLGGQSRNMAAVVRSFPGISPHNVQLVATEALRTDYRKHVGGPSSDPSTGYYGVQGIIACATRSMRVDLYGFNWVGRNTSVHKLQAEEVVIRPDINHR
ncbi:hypothetical protein WJX72_005110 [[Myrmecia] bisecta]|uniref:Uncharacterized protein n=1 Tax=[Myrmecia] bisecta TaxID=41462 RepID=A0AAW1PL91_9CHLO